MPQYTRNNPDGSYSVLDENGTVLYQVPADLAVNAPPEVRERFRATDQNPRNRPSYVEEESAPIPDSDVGPGPDFRPPEMGRAPPPDEGPDLGFGPARAAPREAPTRQSSQPAREPEFEFDLGNFLIGSLAATGGQIPLQFPVWKRRAPEPPAPSPRIAEDRDFPTLPQPTFAEAMRQERIPQEPPEINVIRDGDLPPIPLIERDQLSVDPSLQMRVDQARGRESRFEEMTGKRRTRLESQIERLEKVPRWAQALNIFASGLSGLNTGTTVDRAIAAQNWIPGQIDVLERQLLDLGLSQEELVQAREEAELAPISAGHQLDMTVLMNNHQVMVQEAMQERQMAIEANRQGNERDFQVWSSRLNIALERLRQNMKNMYQGMNIQGALGGPPTADSILAQISPLGKEAQAQAAERLDRANLQGMLQSDLDMVGGDASRALSPMRRRVNAMFARMGLTPPRIDSRMIQNPQTFAEYLVRASGGRILKDQDVQGFQYIPGIPMEQ